MKWINFKQLLNCYLCKNLNCSPVYDLQESFKYSLLFNAFGYCDLTPFTILSSLFSSWKKLWSWNFFISAFSSWMFAVSMSIFIVEIRSSVKKKYILLSRTQIKSPCTTVTWTCKWSNNSGKLKDANRHVSTAHMDILYSKISCDTFCVSKPDTIHLQYVNKVRLWQCGHANWMGAQGMHLEAFWRNSWKMAIWKNDKMGGAQKWLRIKDSGRLWHYQWELVNYDRQTESMRKWSFIFTLLAHLPKLLKSISGRM